MMHTPPTPIPPSRTAGAAARRRATDRSRSERHKAAEDDPEPAEADRGARGEDRADVLRPDERERARRQVLRERLAQDLQVSPAALAVASRLEVLRAAVYTVHPASELPLVLRTL